MKKFTEIKQFRDVIREVKSNHDFIGKGENEEAIYSHTSPYPILTFRGTVKLHGTNSGIVKYKDEHIEYQSRERILNLQQDNSGFMLAMKGKSIEKLFDGIEFNDYCAIYGEWCGQGIQKGIAISQLPKMFVIFAVKIDEVYQDMNNYKHLRILEENIYNIYQFETFEKTIDFNNPELSINGLQELTLKVEQQCPVGNYFNVEGVGEGIVWEYIEGEKRYIFKVKGEKHQNSKVKTLATVDVEVITKMKDFVDYAVTENRLKQGIDKMVELSLPLEMKTTGEYLRWIFNDIIKEEEDTIVKNQIDIKKIGSMISNKAREFWLAHLNNNL